jgi:predicted  nucleic acid-binding Zn-ribbon protein
MNPEPTHPQPTDPQPTAPQPIAPKEVVQWLNEVKLLQQQVKDLNLELTNATQTADAWRSRYEVEGQQRRSESIQAQTTITRLTEQVTQLLAQPELSTELGDDSIALQIKGLINLSDLQSKLFDVWTERDKAIAALKAEQIAHEKTRKDLTMALADAMEVLTPRKS